MAQTSSVAVVGAIKGNQRFFQPPALLAIFPKVRPMKRLLQRLGLWPKEREPESEIPQTEQDSESDTPPKTVFQAIPPELSDSLRELGCKVVTEEKRIALQLRNSDQYGIRLYVIQYGGQGWYLFQCYLSVEDKWQQQYAREFTSEHILGYIGKKLTKGYEVLDLEDIPELP